MKGLAAAEYAQRCMRKLSGLHSRESTALEAMPEVEEEEVKTWLEIAQEKVCNCGKARNEGGFLAFKHTM